MKITVNRSAKNIARCRRSRAILNLMTEQDGLSFYLEFHSLTSDNNDDKIHTDKVVKL